MHQDVSKVMDHVRQLDFGFFKIIDIEAGLDRVEARFEIVKMSAHPSGDRRNIDGSCRAHFFPMPGVLLIFITNGLPVGIQGKPPKFPPFANLLIAV